MVIFFLVKWQSIEISKLPPQATAVGVIAREMKPAQPAFVTLDDHDVDISKNYYAMDKAALVHLPGGAAISKCHMDSVRCFVLPKSTSMKMAAVPSTWVVKQKPPAIIFPKLVDFHDERDKCIAVFWRGVDRDGEPWIVCLRPPFDVEKMLTDKDYCAIKLNQVKSFSPIKNESGGNLLTYTNRFHKESDIFKMQKLPNVPAVLSFAGKDNTKMFVASMQQALRELELRIRRSQQTTRVGQKPPASQAGQQDEQAELEKMREELKFKADVARHLETLVPVMELTLNKRFFVLDSDDWESQLTTLYQHMPCPASLRVHIPTIFTYIFRLFAAGVMAIQIRMPSLKSSRETRRRSRRYCQVVERAMNAPPLP